LNGKIALLKLGGKKMPLEKKEAEEIIEKRRSAEQKQREEIEKNIIETEKNVKKILPFIIDGNYLSEEEIVEKTGITIEKVRQALIWLQVYYEIKVAKKDKVKYYGK
jgi:hypothetical protein